jgi:hypothetical protein
LVDNYRVVKGHLPEVTLAIVGEDPVVGSIVVEQLMFRSHPLHVLYAVFWPLDSEVFPVLVISVVLTLLYYVIYKGLLVDDLLFDDTKHCHLQP